jgi:hypothetical protein
VTSPSQVLYVLSHHYQVAADSVQVCRYQAEAFLLTFHDRQEADQVLHTTPLEGPDWRLVFKRWTRLARALFKPLFFKVLLSIENIPTQIWLVATTQTIVRSSCLIFNVSPVSSDGFDMSQFLAAAWAIHPDFILNEVGCTVPELVEPFV